MANGVITSKYFWFYLAMCIVAVASLAVTCFRRNSLRIFPVDLLLITFGVEVLYINYFIFQNAISTKWILLMHLMILFFYFRVFLQDKKLRFYLLLYLILTGLVEAIWGLSQLYGFSPSYHSVFKLTGSFFNSGPYSGYLTTVAPIALYQTLKDSIVLKKKFFCDYFLLYIRFILSILTFASIILVLPATMSRAAWIAMVISCFFVVFFYYLQKEHIKEYLIKRLKKVIFLTFIVIVLVTMSLVEIYHLKKDSADGRMLIWKTAIQLIPKNPMGVGIGHFSGAYGSEQAVYFKSGKQSKHEEFIAGNPEYAFNEYLQIIIEFGIVPAIVLFVSFFLIVYLGIKRKAIPETGGLVSLLIFAFMSYPFNLLPLLIVLVFLMALILSKKSYVKVENVTEKGFTLNWKFVIFMLIIFCSVLFVSLYHQLPAYKSYQEWNKLKMVESVDSYPEMKKDYEKIYPNLSDQTQFLFEYAQCLSKVNEYKQSNLILKQAIKISCDPMLYNILGKNYQRLGNYKLAEQNFFISSHIVPNRIYPYFLLSNLYSENGKTDSAILMAKKVLEKKPKVQSTATKEMKVEMKKMVEKIIRK